MLRARSVWGGLQEQGVAGIVREAGAAFASILRLTEVPGGETHEKLRDPGSARSAEVGRGAPIVNVFNADSESSPS